MVRVTLVLLILILSQTAVVAENVLDYYHSYYSYCTRIRRTIINLKQISEDPDSGGYEEFIEMYKSNYIAHNCPDIVRRR